MNTNPVITIRPAEPADVPVLLGLIHELAVFEKLAHQMETTEALLSQWLFGPAAVAEALMAEVNGQPAAMAIFYRNYSTFVGRPGMHVEDVYVQPAYRGLGIGTKLFVALAQLAQERNYGRMEWTVLDWNQRARDFYVALGAELLEEWKIQRLDAAGIARLAERTT